jgi:hypothetical protein
LAIVPFEPDTVAFEDEAGSVAIRPDVTKSLLATFLIVVDPPSN